MKTKRTEDINVTLDSQISLEEGAPPKVPEKDHPL